MKKAILITATYMLLGLAWIYFTDAHLFEQYSDLKYLKQIQNAKGYLFVVGTALMLFYAHYLLYRRINEKSRDLDVLINSTDDMIWSIDPSLNLVSFNKSYAKAIEYATGRKLEEGDQVLIDEFGEDLNQRWKEYYERALSGEKFVQIEEAQVEGQVSYAENYFNPIWEDGEAIGVSCFARNITKLVAANKELEGNNRELKSKSDQLEKEKQRLRKAQIVGCIGDWEYDVITGEISWSPMTYEIFNRPESSAAPGYEELVEMLHPDDREYHNRAVKEAINEGKSFDIDIALVSKDEKKYLRSICQPVKDAEGKVILLEGVVQDITDRVIAEEERKVIEKRLLTLANNLPGAIFQYERSPDGSDRMLYLSEGATNLWGYSADQIMENNQLVWQQINKEDLDSVLDSIKSSAENLSRWHTQWRSTLPDGSFQWHEGFGQPRKTKAGTIIWDTIILDVTERKQAEELLHQQQEFNQFLMEKATDAVLACDADGIIMLHNQTWRTWVGRQEMPDLDEWPSEFHIFTADGGRPLKKEELSIIKALEEGQIKDYPFMIKSPGRNNRIIESNGSSLFDNKGKKIGAMVILRDVTKKTLDNFGTTNEILEAIEKERSLLASELHDGLTQELSMVSMNLANLAIDMNELTDAPSFKKASSYLESAIVNSRKLSHQLIPKTVQDIGLVGALQELVDDIMEVNTLEINLYYNESISLDKKTEIHVYRVIQEALNNTIKHAEAKNVTIRIQVRNSELEVIIIDDGKGFDYPVEMGSGKGIGLKTMRSRVSQMKGSFQIESDKTGTTVLFIIPINNNSNSND